MLCGDGFMDFVHRPKSKILKNIKRIKKFKSHVSEVGSASVLRGTEANRIGVLIFSPSIHPMTEAEPASETL
jgi:hypothetical protein